MDEDNNKQSNTPSTDSDVMPSGGSTVGQAVGQGAKKAARKGWNTFKGAVGRGLKAVWALLPMTVKIIVIVVMIILIVICALLMMGMIEEGTTVANSNVDNYMTSDKLTDEDAKSLYSEKSSLIKVKLSDINSIYDQFIKNDEGGAETQTLMKYEIGSNNVSADNRVVSIEDKEPLYKHIMMTEKYNFNSVKWYKYSHTSSSLAKKVDTFKEDKELGLKYPDDSKNEAGGDNPNTTKLEKFIDLTLPYLQTWYIPLAMSNASIINGTEEDNNRAPAFSYNIIKEAYSNIVVNWYELKKHTTVTQYHTYDRVERHDTLYNVTVSEVQKRSSTDALSYETVGYNLDLSNVNKKVNEDSRVSHNTSTNNGLANGTRDPMKEDLISQKDEYTSNYYIKEADVFDAKIINEFNYKVYSDADAQKRINADSSSEKTARWTRTGDSMQNKFEGTSLSYNKGVFSINNNAASSTLEKTETIAAGVPGQSDEYRSVKHTYTVTLGSYFEYENGLEHTVTRMWKDKLSQESSETSEYTIDDLLKYNQSEDRKETVSSMDLCGSSYSSSTSSSSNSTGTSSPATEIKIGNYTYPVFNQGNYQTTTSHGGDTISQAGCGLCSLTTVVGSITGKKVDPISCGNDTNWSGPKTLAQIGADLKNVYNIDTEVTRWDNKNSGPSVSEKEKISKTKITEALQNNNPVIALIKPKEAALGTSAGGGHYITLVGINGNKVIIANSAGGAREEYDIDYVIKNIYIDANISECGFVIAKRSGATSTSTSSSSTTTSTSSGKSEDLKGNYTISKNGYDTIHKSRVTGRSYKLYLQGSGSPWAGEIYQHGETIGAVGCGVTSDAILCTGYGHDTTPKKINDTYDGYHVGQELEKAINNGVISKDWTNFSVGDAIKHMQEGGTFIAHTYQAPYTSREHYMAVIDINESGDEIYVADPAGNYTGWQSSEEFFSKMDRMTPYGKDGGTGSYDGTATSGEGDSSTSSTVCTGTESGKYYTDLIKTDGLNRIDFMNSNPDIFNRYIREGAEYYKYVGYSRSKLTLSYWNLKKLLQEVYEKNGSLPWAYGKTLGFDNIYNSKPASNSNVNGAGIFTWPIPEYAEAGLGMWEQITSTFGNRTHPITGQPGTMHNGIDISAGVNNSAKIVAAASGKVVKAGDSNDGYGNSVIIQHSDGYYTLYGHMAPGSLTVSVGDNVNKGQQIGIMGTTGNSTGNHLHFEVEKFDGEFSLSKYYTSERLDPVEFFNDDCSSIGGGGASGLDLTTEQIKDFAIMIYGEAGGNSYELQVACAASAINQYKLAKSQGKDVDFLEDFIHNTHNFNGYGAAQGHTVSENDSVYKAAVDALNGEDPTGGALYFYAPAAMDPPGSTSSWHESLNYLCTIDGVRFFKP